MDKTKPVERVDQLVAIFDACKAPANAGRMGVEWEMFLHKDGRPLPYTPPPQQNMLSVRFLLEAWAKKFNYVDSTVEENLLVGISRPDMAITLEAGGAIEMVTPPMSSSDEVANTISVFRQELAEMQSCYGFASAAVGTHPEWRLDDMPFIRTDRLNLAYSLLSQKGSEAMTGHMLRAAAALQFNIDYYSENDWLDKFRITQMIQPFVAALFSNATHLDGQETGYRSVRQLIWQKVDPQRCGTISAMYQQQQSYGWRDYVEYSIDVPTYAFTCNGDVLPANGYTFRQWMNGQLPSTLEASGHSPTVASYLSNLSRVYTDVRCKPHLELRLMDSHDRPEKAVGLWWQMVYDPANLRHASEIVARYPMELWQAAHRGLNSRSTALPLEINSGAEILDWVEDFMSALQTRLCAKAREIQLTK